MKKNIYQNKLSGYDVAEANGRKINFLIRDNELYFIVEPYSGRRIPAFPYLKRSAKELYSGLLTYLMDNRNFCWPSMKNLSISTGLSVSTIKRNIKILEEMGMIEVKKFIPIRHGDMEQNIYYIYTLDKKQIFNDVIMAGKNQKDLCPAVKESTPEWDEIKEFLEKETGSPVRILDQSHRSKNQNKETGKFESHRSKRPLPIGQNDLQNGISHRSKWPSKNIDIYMDMNMELPDSNTQENIETLSPERMALPKMFGSKNLCLAEAIRIIPGTSRAVEYRFLENGIIEIAGSEYRWENVYPGFKDIKDDEQIANICEIIERIYIKKNLTSDYTGCTIVTEANNDIHTK